MINQNVYNQIDSFVEQRVGKSKLHEIKFYVDSETAKDKASFVKFLVENNEIIEKGKEYKTIDLCYGSGNLTTHILGDCGIDFSELVLNDVNTDDRNNGIQIGTKQDDDFLDATKFTTKYDLIIFNPQIGGKDTYPNGIVEFEKIEPILYNDTFEKYLNYKGFDTSLLDISVDESEKSILIHSEKMTKIEMNEIFKNIKIFNYYDVFYYSKESKIEGTSTKIVQFRKTLENISHKNSIVIFYGEMNYFKYLLADYTNIRFYLQDSGKQLFVLAKGESSKKCYEKIENQFIENENCEIEKDSDEEDLDIGELMQELEENKIDNSFNGVLQSESSIVTNVQTDNEEKFKQWWYDATFTNADGKEFERPTKNAYFNGIKRLSKEIGVELFFINNVKEIENILDKLQNGALKEFNKNDGYNPSNGLKQYIKFLKLEKNIDFSLDNSKEKDIVIEDKEIEKINFSDEPKGKENWQDFKYKNLLFKGVPGTGKSRAINEIIIKHLGLAKNDKNTLRINIHSASSNSDLMQGIGISSDNGNIKYSEKQGLILDIIKRATFHPNQPFVLILEEIQENSLNELIGDLIYLIEDDKRAKLIADNKEYDNYEELVDKLVDKDDTLDYVEIPYLVNDSTKYKKMIMPNNLFIFCTSNYRDDKKVIEDNLLRRFEVIEIYPKNQEQMGKDDKDEYFFKQKDVSDFLESLNQSILKVMKENHEIHPDRFIIGHAIWQKVNDEKSFYKSFLKLIVEFKDIREIEFELFKTIIKDITPKPFTLENNYNSYYDMIKDIQSKINYDFLS